jgi:hypothetical protein
MRRKVDELAVWLAAGDPAKIRSAREAVVELLKSASRATLR